MLVLFTCCSLSLMAQRARLRVLTWNVENLFDCQDDSLKDDEQFLPNGEYRWSKSRYWRKLDNVSRTIAALTDDDRWPALVGLCEVENDTVMRDLTRRSPLRAARYDYVMTDSPDERGVDVALMYQKDDFQLLYYEGIRVPSSEHGLRPTRDILHVAGLAKGEANEAQQEANEQGRLAAFSDTLHVLVVHFPSQAGGTRASAQNRLLAARTLASVVDTLHDGRLIVMGDFNAEPGDAVFRNLLPPLHSLVPKERKAQLEMGGTYCFRRRWGFLDHILLSECLWQKTRKRAEVARFPFLLKDGMPWRTFRGPSYAGGFSDHLPLWADVEL